jgi:hypothetical protein
VITVGSGQSLSISFNLCLLIGLSCKEELSFPHHLFIYLIIYLHQYGIMDIYLIFDVLILSLFFPIFDPWELFQTGLVT